jgi:hypothetical protein
MGNNETGGLENKDAQIPCLKFKKQKIEDISGTEGK